MKPSIPKTIDRIIKLVNTYYAFITFFKPELISNSLKKSHLKRALKTELKSLISDIRTSIDKLEQEIETDSF